jgi:hypothetical protein
MTLAATLYWLALCGFAGAIIHSELTDRDTANEPFGDTADGDWPSIPEDFELLFHASHNITGRQQDHA